MRRRWPGRRRAVQDISQRQGQAAAVGLRPVRVGVLGEWLAAPQLQRVAEAGQRLRGAVREQPLAIAGRGKERLGVDPALAALGQAVAAGAGADQRRVAQRPPDPAHQHLDVAPGIGRGPPGPQGVGDHVLGDQRSPPHC
jgi:hypothetical protein